MWLTGHFSSVYKDAHDAGKALSRTWMAPMNKNTVEAYHYLHPITATKAATSRFNSSHLQQMVVNHQGDAKLRCHAENSRSAALE